MFWKKNDPKTAEREIRPLQYIDDNYTKSNIKILIYEQLQYI